MAPEPYKVAQYELLTGVHNEPKISETTAAGDLVEE